MPCRCEPTRPYQMYMRRPPPAGAGSLEERTQAADKLMRLHSNVQLMELVRVYKEEGAVGWGLGHTA